MRRTKRSRASGSLIVLLTLLFPLHASSNDPKTRPPTVSLTAPTLPSSRPSSGPSQTRSPATRPTAATSRPSSRPSHTPTKKNTAPGRPPFPRLPFIKTPAALDPYLKKQLKDLSHTTAQRRKLALIVMAKSAIKANKQTRLFVIRKVCLALLDPDARIRRHAAEQLLYLKAKSHWSQRVLLYGLSDADSAVRIASLDSIKELKITLPHSIATLLRLLSDPIPTVRARAARVLGRLPHQPVTATVNALLHALLDPAIEVKRSAALALMELGPQASQALPQLMGQLKHSPPHSEELIRAIGSIGHQSMTAIRFLNERLRHVKEEQQLAIMSSLGKIAQKNIQAQPLLRDALSLPNPQTRLAAIQALGDLGPRALFALDAIISTLRANEDDLRWLALWSIGKIGPKATKALPFVFAKSKDPASKVRAKAIYILADLGPDSAPYLCKILLHSPQSSRLVAAKAIAGMGKKAAALLPCLRKALAHNPPSVQEFIVEAIGHIGRPTQDLLLALGRLLSSPSWPLRQSTTEAIQRLGLLTPSINTKLQLLLKDPEERVRFAAQRALKYLQQTTKPPTPPLPRSR